MINEIFGFEMSGVAILLIIVECVIGIRLIYVVGWKIPDELEKQSKILEKLLSKGEENEQKD